MSLTAVALQHSLWPGSVLGGAERQVTTQSRLETSRPETPSPSHPRARLPSSVLSLRLGGMLTEALITALKIATPAKPCSSTVNVSQCLHVRHTNFWQRHCCVR